MRKRLQAFLARGWLAAAGICLPGGCNEAYLGFAQIELGKPVPAAAIPERAVRTACGMGYMREDTFMPKFGDMPAAELAHGNVYILEALTDKDGVVLGKMYMRGEYHGWGWSLASEFYWVAEIVVPAECFRDPPAGWPSAAERRARQTKAPEGPATGPTSSASPTSRPTVPPFEVFLRQAAAEDGAEASRPAPHLGQYLLAVMEAFDNMPLSTSVPPGKGTDMGATIRVLFHTPGFLSKATQPGFDKRLASPDGRFRAQNIGGRRIRIEHWLSCEDSAFLGGPRRW
jgi:hypothetical protein